MPAAGRGRGPQAQATSSLSVWQFSGMPLPHLVAETITSCPFPHIPVSTNPPDPRPARVRRPNRTASGRRLRRPGGSWRAPRCQSPTLLAAHVAGHMTGARHWVPYSGTICCHGNRRGMGGGTEMAFRSLCIVCIQPEFCLILRD